MEVCDDISVVTEFMVDTGLIRGMMEEAHSCSRMRIVRILHHRIVRILHIHRIVRILHLHHMPPRWLPAFTLLAELYSIKD
jgi:hypothetical protein